MNPGVQWGHDETAPPVSGSERLKRIAPESDITAEDTVLNIIRREGVRTDRIFHLPEKSRYLLHRFFDTERYDAIYNDRIVEVYPKGQLLLASHERGRVKLPQTVGKCAVARELRGIFHPFVVHLAPVSIVKRIPKGSDTTHQLSGQFCRFTFGQLTPCI